MSFDSETSYSGQDITATANGIIRLEEGRGRLVVQKDTVEVLVVNENGVLQNDSANDRVRLGKRSMGDSGLFVSRVGVNVDTASDDDLIFNSNQNTFKIVKSDVVTVNAVGFGQFQQSIPHGQKKVPGIIGYAVYPSVGVNTWAQTPFDVKVVPTSSADTSIASIANANIFITASHITFTVTKTNFAGLNGDWIFRYYLLQETAS